ncbi:fatty acid-binding protein [Eurytemora carolleeae]|uniref:fatty acid-binding protein n=1 Tax=Eurytemora carolleeae TaxID=1294199 RepID=UPI000C7637F5|nr:fatty acid-binding protein [Eurytemora carolleeae]|eukprot:XP_023334988.1 fatty acid-binding protein-like [Eurytemora affinis]
MVQIEGNYQHEKSENLDKFFEKMGLPWAVRKIVCNVSPGLKITQSGDEWKLVFTTPVKDQTIKFKLGEEFEETNPMGEKMQCSAAFADDALVISSKGEQKMGKRTLKFHETGILMTFEGNGFEETATRHFKRV